VHQSSWPDSLRRRFRAKTASTVTPACSFDRSAAPLAASVVELGRTWSAAPETSGLSTRAGESHRAGSQVRQPQPMHSNTTAFMLRFADSYPSPVANAGGLGPAHRAQRPFAEREQVDVLRHRRLRPAGAAASGDAADCPRWTGRQRRFLARPAGQCLSSGPSKLACSQPARSLIGRQCGRREWRRGK
jgi:hypothetical protein